MYRSTAETYPLVCIQALGPTTQAELDQVNRAFASAFDRGGPLMCISDIRRASHDAVQRRLVSVWAEYVKKTFGSRVIATVVVVDSVLVRGALTALNWLSPPVIPQPLAVDIAEAIAIAKHVYERERVAIGADVWGQIRVWFDAGSASATRG